MAICGYCHQLLVPSFSSNSLVFSGDPCLLSSWRPSRTSHSSGKGVHSKMAPLMIKTHSGHQQLQSNPSTWPGEDSDQLHAVSTRMNKARCIRVRKTGYRNWETAGWWHLLRPEFSQPSNWLFSPVSFPVLRPKIHMQF